MGTRVHIPKSLLQKLQSSEGAFHDFLTETHTALVQDESLKEISGRLLKDKAIHLAGLAYQELKSITGLKASVDVSAKF